MSAPRTLSAAQVAGAMNCSMEQLGAWQVLLPPAGADGGYLLDAAGVERLRQCAKVLGTGMTVEQVQQLERRDPSGRLLARYALLAEDCPANVTAHILRSLCVVILAQNRQGRMLAPRELAAAAGLDVESAKRHLRVLQAVGLLRASAERDRWEFAFVPRAISGD